MKLDFPQGYKADVAESMIVTLNRRDFTPSEFLELLTTRKRERLSDHANRIASALGIGCVITRRPALKRRNQ